MRENIKDRGEIERISKKWTKRTKGHDSPWPPEGSLIVPMLIQMEGKVKGYKRTDKTQKRQEKRAQELKILHEFAKIAGQEQTEPETTGRNQEKDPGMRQPHEEGHRPPPYAQEKEWHPQPTSPQGIYPKLQKGNGMWPSPPPPQPPRDWYLRGPGEGGLHSLPNTVTMCPNRLTGLGIHLDAIQIKGPPRRLAELATDLAGDPTEQEGSPSERAENEQDSEEDEGACEAAASAGSGVNQEEGNSGLTSIRGRRQTEEDIERRREEEMYCSTPPNKEPAAGKFSPSDNRSIAWGMEPQRQQEDYKRIMMRMPEDNPRKFGEAMREREKPVTWGSQGECRKTRGTPSRGGTRQKENKGVPQQSLDSRGRDSQALSREVQELREQVGKCCEYLSRQQKNQREATDTSTLI